MSQVRNIRIANTIIKDEQLAKAEHGKYLVNEIFYTLQGEGALSGMGMVFLRFSECNLRCTVKNAGFDCDTEFASSRELGLAEIKAELAKYQDKSAWVLLTGGEPALQINAELIDLLKELNFKIAIETNGTIALPAGIDWISISPKSAEHTLRQRSANEIKYVRSQGMALPEPTISADYFFISPAFQPDGSLLKEDLNYCVNLVKESQGRWRLSVQSHKLLGLR